MKRTACERIQTKKPVSKAETGFLLCKVFLLEFDGGADSLELLLELFGLVLGDSFLQDSGHALDLRLRLGEAQAGDAADFLDDLDLLIAEAGQNDAICKP